MTQIKTGEYRTEDGMKQMYTPAQGGWIDVAPVSPEIKNITADLLEEGREMKIPGEMSPNLKALDMTGGLEDILELYKTQATQYQEQLEEAKKTQEVQSGKLKKLWEGVTGRETKLEEERERFGTDETLNKIQASVATAKGLRENLINLEAERDARKIAIEGKPQSMVSIRGEQALVDRAYNSRIAAASARLSAEGAYMNALQGNLSTARSMATETVNAMVFDQEREYKMLQDTYNMNKDLIDDLGTEYKTAFQNAIDTSLISFQEAKEEKQNMVNLSMEAAKYGVKLDIMGKTYGEVAREFNELVAPLTAEERQLELAKSRADIARTLQLTTEEEEELTNDQKAILSGLLIDLPTYVSREAALADLEKNATILKIQLGELGLQKYVDEINRIFPAVAPEEKRVSPLKVGAGGITSVKGLITPESKAALKAVGQVGELTPEGFMKGQEPEEIKGFWSRIFKL